MQTILLIGLNHETANIDIREKLSFSKDETAIILKTIKKDPVINEIILISTCNRTEVLVTTEDNAAAVKIIKNIISEFKNIPICQFEKSLYIYISDEAIRHIFRVASSLDSMIVGEPQIFGQIKEAYRLATNNKTSGVILNKLLHKIDKDIKLFNAVPLRTDIKPKYITLDTSCLINLLIEENSIEYLKNVKKYKKEIWNK